MPNRTRKEKPTEPTFIFKGTVQKVKAATMKDIALTDQTLIVTVDQIITAPRLLAKLGGRRITVQLSGRQTAQPGQELIFHTYGWVFGDGVAVQAVKQEAVSRGHIALLMGGGDPVERRRSQALQQRFTESATVISGQVSTVRLPSESSPPAGRTRAAAAATAVTGPISEHTPHWREAVIKIDNVHKGTLNQSEVVIRFPASTDVRWYRAPKFQPGQQGYFMLHKTQTQEKAPKTPPKAAAKGGAKIATHTAVPMVGAAAPAGEETYTALHPMDFQSYGEQGGISSLLASNNSDEQSG